MDEFNVLQIFMRQPLNGMIVLGDPRISILVDLIYRKLVLKIYICSNAKQRRRTYLRLSNMPWMHIVRCRL